MSKFNGATTTFQGDVVLPVQADPVTLSIQFLVVKDLSPFNAIMGHAWLHRMKVVPSTYHRMGNYLTEEGQVDLLGSQLAVYQYYQVALDFGHPSSEEARPESSSAREQ